MASLNNYFILLLNQIAILLVLQSRNFSGRFGLFIEAGLNKNKVLVTGLKKKWKFAAFKF
jgi:hypothetical protein